MNCSILISSPKTLCEEKKMHLKSQKCPEFPKKHLFMCSAHFFQNLRHFFQIRDLHHSGVAFFSKSSLYLKCILIFIYNSPKPTQARNGQASCA